MAYVNIISLIYYSVRMEGGHMILIFLAWGDGNFPFRAACTRPSVRSSFSIENTVIRLLGHLACFHLNANKYYSRTCATS